MNKGTSTISIMAMPVAIVCGLLSASASAFAQTGADASQQSLELRRPCSNRTLHGDFGTTIEGFVVGAGVPIRGVSIAHFDGNGNLTQVDHIVTNGMPPPQEWTPGSGTYTVNPDCTGKAVIHTASSFTGVLNLHFVVVKEGREIRQVVDENAVIATAVKVE